MKNNVKPIFILLLAITSITACKKEDTAIDTEYPTIDLTIAEAFPQQCSEVARGKSFTFNARFGDNAALGAYSIDVHHNFDHHTHSTEVSNCQMEAIKSPIKPFLFIKSYSIPADQKEFVATTTIDVPADVDPGDYHFLVRLTDKEGWQTIRGISIKVK